MAATGKHYDPMEIERSYDRLKVNKYLSLKHLKALLKHFDIGFDETAKAQDLADLFNRRHPAPIYREQWEQILGVKELSSAKITGPLKADREKMNQEIENLNRLTRSESQKKLEQEKRETQRVIDEAKREKDQAKADAEGANRAAQAATARLEKERTKNTKTFIDTASDDESTPAERPQEPVKPKGGSRTTKGEKKPEKTETAEERSARIKKRSRELVEETGIDLEDPKNKNLSANDIAKGLNTDDKKLEFYHLLEETGVISQETSRASRSVVVENAIGRSKLAQQDFTKPDIGPLNPTQVKMDKLSGTLNLFHSKPVKNTQDIKYVSPFDKFNMLRKKIAILRI